MGTPPTVGVKCKGVGKCHNFRPITCYISETVEDRWVHAANVMRLTSIESFFHPYDIYRDCHTFFVVPCNELAKYFYIGAHLQYMG